MTSSSDLGPGCVSEHCITCADEGLPMTVIALDESRELALCADATGARSSVETALVDPVGPGDQLLVHAGTAIAKLGASSGTGSR